jgi:hypothetical protein
VPCRWLVDHSCRATPASFASGAIDCISRSLPLEAGAPRLNTRTCFLPLDGGDGRRLPALWCPRVVDTRSKRLMRTGGNRRPFAGTRGACGRRRQGERRVPHNHTVPGRSSADRPSAGRRTPDCAPPFRPLRTASRGARVRLPCGTRVMPQHTESRYGHGGPSQDDKAPKTESWNGFVDDVADIQGGHDRTSPNAEGGNRGQQQQGQPSHGRASMDRSFPERQRLNPSFPQSPTERPSCFEAAVRERAS